MAGKYGRVIDPQEIKQGKYGKIVSPEPSKTVAKSKSGLLRGMSIGQFMETVARARTGGVSAADAPRNVEELKRGAETAITAAEIGGSIAFPGASPAIMGAGEFARSKGIKGESYLESIKTGAKYAALDAALLGTGKYIATPAAKWAGRGIGKLGIQISKRVGKPALNQALKNPDLLIQPQKALVDVSDDIIKAAKGLKDQADDVYGLGLEKIIAKTKAGSTIPTRSVVNSIKKLGGDPEIIASKMIGQARKQGIALSDDVISKFFSGKEISFSDAKKINSLLASTLKDLQKAGTTAELGSGIYGRIMAAKQANMKAMEKAAPGIRQLNQQYAIDRGIAEKAVKALGSESSQKTVAKQLLGQVTSKTKDARNLIKLEQRLGQPVTESLKDAMARQLFDQTADNLLKYRTPEVLIGAGAGGTYGYRKGGPMGGALGVLAGGGAALAGGQALSPEMIGKGIQFSSKIPQLLRFATTPARIGAERLILK